MLKDVKKTTDLEKIFQETPMAIIDFAYEAVTNNVILTEEQKEVFNANTKLLEKVPLGDIMKKTSMFLELDILSTNFSVLEGLKVWNFIQYYADENVRQTRFAQ
mgnify:CR=1 FL=1